MVFEELRDCVRDEGLDGAALWKGAVVRRREQRERRWWEGSGFKDVQNQETQGMGTAQGTDNEERTRGEGCAGWEKRSQRGT